MSRFWPWAAGDDALYTVVVFILVFLLPIIPASLLFWKLPSTGDLNGTLQGMQLKLGGAFAGYFALVLVIIANHQTLIQPPPPAYVTWTVRGKLLGQQGQRLEPIGPSDVEMSPPMIRRDGDGEFTLRYYVLPDPNGNYDYPYINLSHKDSKAEYKPVQIHLSPDDHFYHDKGVTLNITQTKQNIDLHEVALQPVETPYNAGAAPLNAATAQPAKEGKNAPPNP